MTKMPLLRKVENHLMNFARFWRKANRFTAELPQSAAGLFGYLGYDMVRHIEHLPNINSDPIGVPDALFLRLGRGSIGRRQGGGDFGFPCLAFR